MANYCANSILGNDANSGAYDPAVPDDWSTAKRTIGAMVAAMASGDTGYVTGYFNEAVTLPRTITLQGVGVAIVDGSSIGGTGILQSVTGVVPTLRDLCVQNWTTGLLLGQRIQAAILERVSIRACTTGVVFDTYETSHTHTVFDSLIYNCSTGITWRDNNGGAIRVIRSTIIASSAAIVFPAFGPYLYDSFLSAPTLIEVSGSSPQGAQFNYNCLDFSGANKTIIGGTNYDTLPLHQAGTGLDLNSLDSTPAAECIDTTHDLYGLRPTSQLLRRGSAGRDIGWGGAMLACSPGINADVYDHPYIVSGAIVKDGSGYWVRDGVTTAVARFGDPTGLLLADLGAARNVGQLLLEGTETFHTSQFDQSAGAGPYLTERYKLSATQDALSDGTGWTTIKRNGRIDVATYRYFGREFTWMGP